MKTLHRRVALALALPLLWFLITGLALGVACLGRENSVPYRLPEGQGEKTTELDLSSALLGMLDAVLSEQRLGELRGIQFAESSRHSHHLLFHSGEKWFFAPAAQAPFARFGPANEEAVELLRALHRGKIWGDGGRFAFSACALALFSVLLSGLFIFRWKKRLKNSRDLHRWLGAAAFLPLSILLLSGGLWNISKELRGWKAMPQATTALTSAEWQRAFAIALNAHAESEAEGIYATQGSFLILFRDQTRVYVSGEQFKAYCPFTKAGWFEPLYAIHSGRLVGVKGLAWPIAWGLIALILTFVGVSLGIKQGWGRKKKPKLPGAALTT